MKIGLILPGATISYQGGVVVQARMWKESLESRNNEVVQISTWGYEDWNSFDMLIFLGLGPLVLDFIYGLHKFPHIKFAIAPIIDFTGSPKEFGFRAKYIGSVRLSWRKALHELYYCRDQFSLFLVRSEHEKRFLTEGLHINPSKVKIVPLSLRFKEDIPPVNLAEKERFCFHVSRLATAGKNVARLVEAAKKYKFQLKLAGSFNGIEQEKWLMDLIDGEENIEYVGYLSETELKEYYKRAKVFALPSLIEGVGMVAMEAAAYGAEIVLTNLGAPKDYYSGRAILVSPYDVDEIGSAILKALDNGFSQPELQKYILEEYSFDTISDLLNKTIFDFI